MPSKPIQRFREDTDNISIFNAIRKNATSDYQRRVPEATKANIKTVVESMMNNRLTRNEFLDALVNQIGLVIVRTNNWTNPLAVLKRGVLEFGDTIEEIQVGLVKSYVYDPDRDQLERALFGQHRPNVQASLHKIDRQEYYPVTINRDMLRRAFTSDTGLITLVNEIMASPTVSDNHDEFNIMCSLFKVYDDAEGFFKVNVPNINDVNTSNADQARVFLKKLRAMAGNLQFLNPHYNASGMHVSADPAKLVLFATPEAVASLDVDALAAAFNMSRAEAQMRIIQIPAYNFAIPGAQAVLTTEDFFVVADTLYETTTQPNAVGLYDNYFLHHHQVISVSRFVPAILFTTEAGTIIEIEDTPVTGMTPLTVHVADSEGNASDTPSTEFRRGAYHQVLGSAVTTPEGGYNSAIMLELSGAESPRTYITQTGTVHVSLDESAEELTVTATSVDDDSFHVDLSLPVTGTYARLWPDPEVIEPEPAEPEPAEPPTGATAGTPGSFTPHGSEVPANLAALQALGALGQTAAWEEGEHVILGDSSHAHWDGDSWEDGDAPA